MSKGNLEAAETKIANMLDAKAREIREETREIRSRALPPLNTPMTHRALAAYKPLQHLKTQTIQNLTDRVRDMVDAAHNILLEECHTKPPSLGRDS